MNPETLNTIFEKCADFWGILVSFVEEEYEKELFTITSVKPDTYRVDHNSRPDLVVIIEDEG